ncbi:histidine kinase [Microbacterium sp. KUDC0406]|uniref:sensor histidine kinase n=1 Tax=Microbacterium sp. KUDC0406 TaxID=2909588 RepID=UPI001F2D5B91|nr:histidine kinase [Microbacterium sp. KUDC0406]UJP09715.1 histidine kinase [Microbacterium sp. KUDC0406]
MTSDSRSSSAREGDELRLPRPPGVIRRFWARHPLFADILIALSCLLLGLVPGASLDASVGAAVRIGTLAMPFTVIVACLLLLRRRQWPVVAFVASMVAAVSYLFAANPAGGPLLLVTSYTLAVYRSVRACWTALGIGIGGLAVIGVSLSLTGTITWSASINAILGELVLGLIGALIGVNVGNRKRYMEAVLARSRQLLVERDQHAQLAAAAERERIAREMHDIVSHSLTVVVALSEGAAATGDPDRARDASLAAADTARSALSEMRSMLGVLRAGDAPLEPAAPIDPAEPVAAARRAGFTVSLITTGAPELPPTVSFAVGRIVQEGLTNAMRHAPKATAIDVRIDYADPLVVEIVNDGATTATDDPGFGLRGLAERAAHLGGSFRSGAVGGGRWMLRAELPHPSTGSDRSTGSGAQAGSDPSTGSGAREPGSLSLSKRPHDPETT